MFNESRVIYFSKTIILPMALRLKYSNADLYRKFYISYSQTPI